MRKLLRRDPARFPSGDLPAAVVGGAGGAYGDLTGDVLARLYGLLLVSVCLPACKKGTHTTVVPCGTNTYEIRVTCVLHIFYTP